MPIVHLPKAVFDPIRKRAMRVIESREPDNIIGPREAPYMLRWITMPRAKLLPNAYIHLFKNDDDDRALHDHPRASMSLILDGVYREVYAQNGFDPRDKEQHSVRMIRAGDVVFRSAKFSHRIELVTPTALTLFMLGPKTRDWGFWCPKGWRHWEVYSDPSEVDYGLIGRGCD